MYLKYVFDHTPTLSKIFNFRSYKDNIVFDVMESNNYNNYLQSYRVFMPDTEVYRVLSNLESTNFANLVKYGEVERVDARKYC